jgi:probable F420-dependent oxidoreductase
LQLVLLSLFARRASGRIERRLSMKVGITCGGIGPYASGAFVRASAREAERAGFAHYWMPDHVVQFAEYPESTYPYSEGSGQKLPEQSGDAPLQFGDDTYANVDPSNPLIDPVIGMAWAAAATSTIEVGSNILVLPQRNPVVLAKELATLDSFAQGRVLLGVGVGWAKEEFVATGADFARRGKNTDEAIAAMRTLWGQPVSTFSGSFVAFKNVYSYPKPARAGGVPIIIGGESKPAMRRVARLGDGWLPYNLPVDRAAAVITELKMMTRDAGRDPATLRIIKIVYSNANLRDLKRYRDAGVTEFNVASSGEIPLDEKGLSAKFAEWAEVIVNPIREL